MLQFSKNRAVGRCAFADRHNFRLEFSWRHLDQAPDFTRLMADYGDKLRRENKGVTVNLVRHGVWHGLEATPGDQVVRSSRFGRYLSEHGVSGDGTPGVLLEVVFLWPGRIDQHLSQRVLDSVREEPTCDQLRRWCAFGLDMRVGSDLALQACQIEPARARMVFGDDSSRGPKETYRRLGLIRYWLEESVTDWLEAQEPKVSSARRSLGRSDHRIELIEGAVSSGATGRLLGKRGWCQVAAWICPCDGRLYSVKRVGRRNQMIPLEELATTRLRCCAALAADRAMQSDGGGETMRADPEEGFVIRRGSWEQMLRVQPVRNHAAQPQRNGAELRIVVPRQRPRFLVPPLSWVFPHRSTRTLELDRIGTQIWNTCDGERTVEQVVDVLASDQKLTFHEARVATTSYLKMLMERGAIAMLGEANDE